MRITDATLPAVLKAGILEQLNLPGLYETDGQQRKLSQKMVGAKLFSMGHPFIDRVYLAEYSAEDRGHGPHVGFGFLADSAGDGQWDYVHLADMATQMVPLTIRGIGSARIPCWELDVHFGSPRPVSEALADDYARLRAA